MRRKFDFSGQKVDNKKNWAQKRNEEDDKNQTKD
jgi:hypothetical protein